jgi:hypothetical protein
LTKEIDTKEENKIERKSIRVHTENFEGEAKKVGEVLIGNEVIPVHEFSVNIIEKNEKLFYSMKRSLAIKMNMGNQNMNKNFLTWHTNCWTKSRRNIRFSSPLFLAKSIDPSFQRSIGPCWQPCRGFHRGMGYI